MLQKLKITTIITKLCITRLRVGKIKLSLLITHDAFTKGNKRYFFFLLRAIHKAYASRNGKHDCEMLVQAWGGKKGSEKKGDNAYVTQCPTIADSGQKSIKITLPR